jgi:hypothetical protein
MSNGIAPQFEVLPTAKEAWSKVDGCKTVFVFATIIYILGVLANQVIGLMATEIGGDFFGALINAIILLLLLAPLNVGMRYMGLQRARGLNPIVQNIFYIFKKELYIQTICYFLILTALVLVAGIIIVFLSIIPIINLLAVFAVSLATFYIFTRMSLTIFYIFDKNEKVILAIKHSIAVTKLPVWKMMLAYILIALAMFFGVITLFIGLIWMVPFAYTYLGTIYQEIGLQEIPAVSVEMPAK